jgi:hypothetical protein
LRDHESKIDERNIIAKLSEYILPFCHFLWEVNIITSTIVNVSYINQEPPSALEKLKNQRTLSSSYPPDLLLSYVLGTHFGVT